jgi:glycosyltransferase involved in cell wall biosynthesis
MVIEAFALGKPVIGSRIGGIQELIEHSKTGLTFEPGNSVELKGKILWLLNHPDKLIEMGRNARRFVEDRCHFEYHYRELIKIYHRAMVKHR